VAAAQLESRRIGQSLVQDGIDLISDVRLAFVELTLAQDRRRLTEESARLREGIADLAEARLRAGDASELDVASLRLDGLTARVETRRTTWDLDLARQRLVMLMGVQSIGLPSECITASPLPQAPCEVDSLLEVATSSRPDLLAAQAAVHAAAQRARLSRWDYLRVIGVLPDANGKGEKGFEAGPGVQFTVPLFHQNQGAIARAEAELARAHRTSATLRDTIILEVQQAHTRMLQADAEVISWREEIVPLAESAVASADKAFRGGGASMLLVLETSRQLLAAQLRQAQAEADLRRAGAELDRAVGRRAVAAESTVGPASSDAVEILHP
jgi:cobalt-zinc-cadmium efflux system outer membrane protein